jgi:hypothetical protein
VHLPLLPSGPSMDAIGGGSYAEEWPHAYHLFDASRRQDGASEPRRPIRSSALRAHSNHEGEGWHSPFIEWICARARGRLAEAG